MRELKWQRKRPLLQICGYRESQLRSVTCSHKLTEHLSDNSDGLLEAVTGISVRNSFGLKLGGKCSHASMGFSSRNFTRFSERRFEKVPLTALTGGEE